MRIAPVQHDPATLALYGALFDACFPGAGKFTPAYLTWLYAANPDGPAVGMDAWDGERLAAHYVCIPARAWVEGREGGGASFRVLLPMPPGWLGTPS